MLKELLREHLLEYIDEAKGTKHFDERINDVINNIFDIYVSDRVFLPEIPVGTQKTWVKEQIKQLLKEKVRRVVDFDFPDGRELGKPGICIIVPLGKIKVKPINHRPINANILATRSRDVRTGDSYFLSVYDNRITTIVLADPTIASNQSTQHQLDGHIGLNKKDNWPVNVEDSYVDNRFSDPIVVDMSKFPN